MIVIAELASNPVVTDWDTEPYCRAASIAGATHVKIQLFLADHFPESERKEKRRLEFPRTRIGDFVAHANRYGLCAGASVFDEGAVDLATSQMNFLKMAAREQDNYHLIDYAIARAVRMPFYQSFDVRRMQPGRLNVIPFGVVPIYPTPMRSAIRWLIVWASLLRRKKIPQFGWSSHTTGAADCFAAKFLGATVVEKHLALGLPGEPEAAHSLTPDRFQRMARWLI